MKIRHLTYFIMLNFINQRAYFQRISYNFNEVLKLKNKLILKYPVKGGLLQSYLCPSISAPNIWHFLKTTKNF